MEKSVTKKTPLKKAGAKKIDNVKKRLTMLISELKAPKGQRNNFGKYNYRSCEDILESVKPLLLKYELHLSIKDELKELGGYIYIESTSTISGYNEKDLNDEVYIGIAQAGVDPNRKGMDIAQCFGSSSSYSRKYSLNSIFLIDDTKDSDAMNQHNKNQETTKKLCTAETFDKMLEAYGTDFKGETIDFNWITKRYNLNPNQVKTLKEVDNG